MHLVLLLVILNVFWDCAIGQGYNWAGCNWRVCYNGADCRYDTCYCSTGWTGVECRDRVCTIACNLANGNCLKAHNQCVCNEDWIGPSCEQRPELYSWCYSIKNNNAIDNTLLDTFGDDVLVNCENKDFTVPKSHLLDLGSKIQTDSNTVQSSLLYSLWQVTPDISNYCCITDTSNEFTSSVRQIVTFANDFHNIAQAISASEVQQKMKENCQTTNDDLYCSVAYAIPMMEQVALLPGSPTSWTEQDNQAVNVILFHLMVLIKSMPSYYDSLQDIVTAEKETEIYTNIINRILQYIQEGDNIALKDLQKNLPKMHVYTQTSSSCNSDLVCICMKMVAQLHSYVEELKIHENSLVINGRKRILLNTGIDYIEFLKQKQLDRILQVLDEQHLTSMSIATALKGEITSQFTNLKSYYQHVASFNGDIATADIGYITGRLDGFKERITSVVDTFKEKMGVLLDQMLLGAGLELAEAAITMALAIAEACNPLAWLFGGVDPNSVADAIADFANAVALLSQGVAVQVAWNNVQTKATEISDNFDRNRVLLENVKVLVYEETESREEFEDAKNSFLEQYTGYTPHVSHDDLVEITATWSSLVEAACEVIDAFTTSAGRAVAAIVNGQNLCVDLPVLAERMGGLYENIYDFQFDLMDAVAEYMRAKVTEDAAEEISTELTTISGQDPDDENTLTTLQRMGGLTFVTYKTHMLQAINSYCNILQYKEGGKRPIECKGPSTDLSLLIARQVTSCAKERFRYYQVPTTPSGQNDKAYVDVSELFKGAIVNFKIPNSQWLVDHHWINENEMNQTFLVEELEVFLPITPTRPTHFSVTADPILNNQLHSGINDTEYMMVPHVLLTSEYDMGPKRTYCRLQKISNPYTSCGAEQRSFVCSSSDMFPQSNHGIYPSLYSEWAIKIKGGEHLTSPNPATEISVIFGLKLCIAAENDDIFDDLVKRNEVDDCCPSGQYRPNITADCADCPVNSHSALSGHYCAKD